MKVYVASFNRASDGVLSKLIDKMKKEDLQTDNYKQADYILAVGDRKETFDFVLERFRENKPIMHLWAGEISQGTHDEVYRHAITLMSNIQLCSNENAKTRVKKLCMAIGKKYMTVVIGNLFLDNLDNIDESLVPKEKYDLILYNPPTIQTTSDVDSDIRTIEKIRGKNYIWIEPNGDRYSDLLLPYTNMKTLPRQQFLGLLKNCDRYISNSSSMYVEAPYLIKQEQIIPIGLRNSERETKYSDMSISNASDKIIKFLKILII